MSTVTVAGPLFPPQANKGSCRCLPRAIRPRCTHPAAGPCCLRDLLSAETGRGTGLPRVPRDAMAGARPPALPRKATEVVHPPSLEPSVPGQSPRRRGVRYERYAFATAPLRHFWESCGHPRQAGSVSGISGASCRICRSIHCRRLMARVLYSVRSTAAGVRAAMRPGMAATRLPSTRAPSAMATIAKAGTVGLGTT